ncbi:MAG: metallophosphatase domain-containing protein [Planctomycetes bacterium]|nr:metallophosphatase domain-containing protein [Planctomycetota bacterium]
MTRIVCISDTHGHLDALSVPEGDVLIHAGDFCGRGDEGEIRRFLDRFRALSHRDKVLIAGNHDELFEAEPERARDLVTGIHYLQDSGAEIAGLRFWGSPWQPAFFDWAFNLPRGPALAAKWALIPSGTDVLVTHGPPAGILDRVHDGSHAGCADLLAAIARVRPRLHVFGHIHEDPGLLERAGTIHVNASSCDRRYRPLQAPITVDL